MNIAILGSGYVGLVAGVCFADAGHSVYCVDSNEQKIKTLNEGKVPFYEPGLDDLFEMNRKRMTFTSQISKAVDHCQVVFVAVGTPEMVDGSADMEPTFKALGEICQAAREPKFIVLKSTVPIGTYRKVKAFCKENAKVEMHIINNPEFLRQGAALEDFLQPDRVVIGCDDDKSKQVMQEIYEPFMNKSGKQILFMDNTSAEMTKYAANSFLAIKISFINELALLADKLGADIESVKAGFTSDSRINPAFFNPGIGYGGSCFPKDVRALIHTGKQNDLDLKLLKAADDVNERQKTILTTRLLERVGSLKGKEIAVWGLAFKPRTDDVRRAPSLKIIEDLFLNGAKVRAYDPIAKDNAIEACRVPFEAVDSALAAVEGADALLIVTEWPEFRSVDLKQLKAKMRQPLIFDGRNLFDPAKMKSAGIEYVGIGQANSQRQYNHLVTTPVFGQPQPGIQYTDRPGAYGILLNDDQWMALVKTPNGRFLPGGGLEGNESPEQALQREIFEEVGIRILSFQAIGEASQYVYSRFYKQGFRKHGFFYTCTWEMVPGTTPQADHSLEWFKPENVLEAMSLEFQKWMVKKSLGL